MPDLSSGVQNLVLATNLRRLAGLLQESRQIQRSRTPIQGCGFMASDHDDLSTGLSGPSELSSGCRSGRKFVFKMPKPFTNSSLYPIPHDSVSDPSTDRNSQSPPALRSAVFSRRDHTHGCDQDHEALRGRSRPTPGDPAIVT